MGADDQLVRVALMQATLLPRRGCHYDHVILAYQPWISDEVALSDQHDRKHVVGEGLLRPVRGVRNGDNDAFGTDQSFS